jgi:D-glycero-alpha-D-manno-heptose-7-phosphate kinase
MAFQHLNDILVDPSQSLSGILQIFDRHARHTGGIGIVLVVDPGRRLLGTTTEGDVRRALIDGIGLDTPVSMVMEKSFTVARFGSTRNQLLQLFDLKIKHIPLVDEAGVIVDLAFYHQFHVITDDDSSPLASRAPLRISFAGGGSDLSSAFQQTRGAVVSATINRYAHAYLQSRDDSRITIECVDTGKIVQATGVDSLSYDGTLDLHKAAIRLLSPNRGFSLKTWTDVMFGSGLGASSSLLVAIISALRRFSRKELSRAQIADLAFQAERIELGFNGGWQDHYASAFGGVNLIEFEPTGITVTPINLEEGIRAELECGLVLCRVGNGRDSAAIQTLSQANGIAHHETVAAQSKMAHDCLRSLVTSDLRHFASLLTTSWHMKRQLGDHVSTLEIDRIFELGMASGARGGKLLGAGGGGHLLFYADQSNVSALIHRLRKEGLETFQISIGTTGVECWLDTGAVEAVKHDSSTARHSEASSETLFADA